MTYTDQCHSSHVHFQGCAIRCERGEESLGRNKAERKEGIVSRVDFRSSATMTPTTTRPEPGVGFSDARWQEINLGRGLLKPTVRGRVGVDHSLGPVAIIGTQVLVQSIV